MRFKVSLDSLARDHIYIYICFPPFKWLLKIVIIEGLARNSKKFANFFFEFTLKNQRLQKKSNYFVTNMWKFAKKECWLV
jgi:hypothetical protein